jgi:hypothetical protein
MDAQRNEDIPMNTNGTAEDIRKDSTPRFHHQHNRSRRPTKARCFDRFGVNGCVALFLIFILLPARLYAESYPAFDKAYWEDEAQKATGKVRRGAALGVVGVASIAPTAILAVKSVSDTKRYLPYAVFSAIATLGMSLHGFFSISYGRYQRDKAKHFAARYDGDPSEVSLADEQQYYLESKRKTTQKLILFGSVLVLQSAIMLANGIVLSIQKHKGTAWGNIKSWPSYLLGGLLLPTGTFLIVRKAMYMNELSRLESSTATTKAALAIQPFFGYDATFGGFNAGLSAQISY